MEQYHAYHTYLNLDGAALFTAVCLPRAAERFPTVIMRSPYVDKWEEMTEEEVLAHVTHEQQKWLDAGYAVVFQHCRGRGKSSGDCVPYIHEREDGLFLQDWIRHQPFYNGELYLSGGSYTASVHFVTAPFADDIKGAVLKVQDCERYNCNYRNGFYKMGLHGGWYVDMYKKKSIRRKNYSKESFHTLPLIDFSKTVLGERAADFDEILLHPKKEDPFWRTRYGGGEAHDAIRNANIPILLVTGFYDIYTGGVFDMWKGLSAQTREKCALLVHPYDHGGNASGTQPICFAGGGDKEQFGEYGVAWLDFVRGKREAPFAQGQVTYYQLFGDKWCTDTFDTPTGGMTFPLGEGERTYTYNPFAPAGFRGGLSANFGGNAWQDAPSSRYDILSFLTPAFREDTLVKGKMRARLRVRSDCEDTCFYVRISLVKEEGYYGLRDDIQQISNFCVDYTPGEEVDLDFSFDEHAFVAKAGESLRIDVSSSAYPYYVRHTNYRGPYALQERARVAHNTVLCDRSHLAIFAEPVPVNEKEGQTV